MSENELKAKCPRCGNEETTVIARGQNRKLWACMSPKCSENEIGMTLMFQPGSNVPAIWELTSGKMHPLKITSSADNTSQAEEN